MVEIVNYSPPLIDTKVVELEKEKHHELPDSSTIAVAKVVGEDTNFSAGYYDADMVSAGNERNTKKSSKGGLLLALSAGAIALKNIYDLKEEVSSLETSLFKMKGDRDNLLTVVEHKDSEIQSHLTTITSRDSEIFSLNSELKQVKAFKKLVETRLQQTVDLVFLIWQALGQDASPGNTFQEAMKRQSRIMQLLAENEAKKEELLTLIEGYISDIDKMNDLLNQKAQEVAKLELELEGNRNFLSLYAASIATSTNKTLEEIEAMSVSELASLLQQLAASGNVINILQSILDIIIAVNPNVSSVATAALEAYKRSPSTVTLTTLLNFLAVTSTRELEIAGKVLKVLKSYLPNELNDFMSGAAEFNGSTDDLADLVNRYLSILDVTVVGEPIANFSAAPVYGTGSRVSTVDTFSRGGMISKICVPTYKNFKAVDIDHVSHRDRLRYVDAYTNMFEDSNRWAGPSNTEQHEVVVYDSVRGFLELEFDIEGCNMAGISGKSFFKQCNSRTYNDLSQCASSDSVKSALIAAGFDLSSLMSLVSIKHCDLYFCYRGEVKRIKKHSSYSGDYTSDILMSPVAALSSVSSNHRARVLNSMIRDGKAWPLSGVPDSMSEWLNFDTTMLMRSTQSSLPSPDNHSVNNFWPMSGTLGPSKMPSGAKCFFESSFTNFSSPISLLTATDEALMSVVLEKLFTLDLSYCTSQQQTIDSTFNSDLGYPENWCRSVIVPHDSSLANPLKMEWDDQSINNLIKQFV